MMNFPILVGVVSFLVMFGTARLGARFFRGYRKLQADERDDFGFVLGATLTLLGLLIGFTFSMAIGRYDQRKNFEEEEANAIGTEYVRAELLPAGVGTQVQASLVKYLDQRILFYTTRAYTARSRENLQEINHNTAQLQNEMWAAVKTAAAANPNPVNSLVLEGMNDVLNRQGYTQAAWWNRIPYGAWLMMAAIALCCNFMLGFEARDSTAKKALLLVLPIVLAISFFLLADLDSPRGGVIRVQPQNLLSLAESLRPQ